MSVVPGFDRSAQDLLNRQKFRLLSFHRDPDDLADSLSRHDDPVILIRLLLPVNVLELLETNPDISLLDGYSVFLRVLF